MLSRVIGDESEDPDAEPAIAFPTVPSEYERRVLLRRALASALRAGRHVGLLDGEAPTSQRTPFQPGPVLAAMLLLWFPAATLGDRLGLSFVWWLVLLLASLLAIGLLARTQASQNLLAVVVLIAAPLSLIPVLQEHGRVWFTHAGPTLLVLLLAVITRSVNVRSARDIAVAAAAVVQSAPLLAPLALVVLVMPALSADVWQAAVHLSVGGVGVLFVITVVPLYLFVLRQLLGELPGVLRTGSERLAASGLGADLTRTMLEERLPIATQAEVLALVDREVDTSWPADPTEYGAVIAGAERSQLRVPTATRLAFCVLVVAIAMSLYLYAIFAVIVDPSVARSWTGADVPAWSAALLGARITLPGGIYLQLVALLGTLATATFLAFALLEERFSTALGDALVRLPGDRLLALAIPYLALREESIVHGPSEWDIVDPGSSVGGRSE